MNSEQRPVLSVRAFVAATSREHAEATWSVLSAFAQEYGTPSLLNLRPYWKTEGQFEIFFSLEPTADADSALAAFATAVGPPSATVPDGTLIWVKGEEDIIEPSVAWMSAELFLQP